MPHGRDDDPKIFDVSKPHKITPSASSRPIIVGHHPIMADPMVLEERYRHPKPLNPQLAESEEPKLPAQEIPDNSFQPPSINVPNDNQSPVTPPAEKAYTTYGAPAEQPANGPLIEPPQASSPAPIFDGDASDSINQKLDSTSSVTPQQPLPENPLLVPAGAAGRNHNKNQMMLALALFITIVSMAFLAAYFLLK